MKVLIADDHKLVATSLAIAIKKLKNIEVVNTVSNGLEALSFINENEVDIVLLDIEVPVLNGIDTAKKIKSVHGNSVKILILSMHDSANHIMDAFKAGIHGYILKSTLLLPKKWLLPLQN